MRLTGHAGTWLMAILLYSGTLPLGPGLFRHGRPGAVPERSCSQRTDSCPMCSQNAPGAPCQCCEGNVCSCGVSPGGGEDSALTRTSRPALPRTRVNFPVTLEFVQLPSSSPHCLGLRSLPVLTPPPKFFGID
jgi:hypothetical protein